MSQDVAGTGITVAPMLSTEAQGGGSCGRPVGS